MPDKEKKEAYNEAKLMKMFNHPNIIQFYDVYKTKRQTLCIVMEYADGGDLNSLIKKKKKALKESGDESTYFTEEEILKMFT